MASKLFAFVCVQMVLFNMVYGQVIGRVGGCGCGCGNMLPVAEQILPSYLPGQQLIYEQPTTVIQDSTVANNLANALQLLIVSNLLSNTLPLDPCGCSQPLELLTTVPACPNSLPALAAPLPALTAPLSLASCGCGGGCGTCGGCGACGSCGCGLNFNPYSIIY